jgi:hypothetical protein
MQRFPEHLQNDGGEKRRRLSSTRRTLAKRERSHDHVACAIRFIPMSSSPPTFNQDTATLWNSCLRHLSLHIRRFGSSIVYTRSLNSDYHHTHTTITMSSIPRNPGYPKRASVAYASSVIPSPRAPMPGHVTRNRSVSMPDRPSLYDTISSQQPSRLPRPRTNAYASSSIPDYSRFPPATFPSARFPHRRQPSSGSSTLKSARPLSIVPKKGASPQTAHTIIPPRELAPVIQAVKLDPQTIFRHIKRVTKGDPASQSDRGEFLAAHERQLGEQREREEVRRMYLSRRLQPTEDCKSSLSISLC